MKSSRSRVYSVRLTPELGDLVEEKAEKQHRSTSSFIELVLIREVGRDHHRKEVISDEGIGIPDDADTGFDHIEKKVTRKGR